jgi:hypothetical protein
MPLSLTTSILLTGAAYEYHHHAPDFLAAGGTQRELDDLAVFVASFHKQIVHQPKQILLKQLLKL